MASIDGTVSIDGAPPAVSGDLNVQAYDLAFPMQIDIDLPCGFLYTYPNYEVVANPVTGAYSFPALDDGHDYRIMALGDFKTSWYNSHSYATATTVNATGAVTGIDFSCDSNDGTFPQGTILNSPADATFIYLFLMDATEWIVAGVAFSMPDAVYPLMAVNAVYATEDYRMVFIASDIDGNFIASGFYPNQPCEGDSTATTFPGDATGIDHDFGSTPAASGGFWVTRPAGTGPHFPMPRSTKRRR